MTGALLRSSKYGASAEGGVGMLVSTKIEGVDTVDIRGEVVQEKEASEGGTGRERASRGRWVNCGWFRSRWMMNL